MIAGGEVTVRLDPTQVRDGADVGSVAGDDVAEIEAALENRPTDSADLNENTSVELVGTGETYKWKDIKDAVKQAAHAANLDPNEVKKKLSEIILALIPTREDEVKAKKRALEAAEANLRSSDTPENRAALQKAREELITEKNKLDNLIRKAIASGADQNNATIVRARALANSSLNGSSGSGSSVGSFSAQVVSPSYTTTGGGTATPQSAAGGSPMSAMTGGANGAGGGLFSGVPPFSTASFARAIFLDGEISDGFVGLNQSRREGQRLMMLFFYFARMAASGDLGAMYQFIKFINYIIAKDKAKQNIQISGKLIQLQDTSRKATDALMKVDSSDKNQNEFLKAMHKARSDEATISTSQKLLADMLQEFAHVVETLTNSVKNLLDAWGRVQRTASSR